MRLTEEEKIILKNTPDIFRYIARDREHILLMVYTHKPSKDYKKGIWNYDHLIDSRDYWYTEFDTLRVFSHLFKDVQWTDDEPLEFRNEKGEFLL